MMTKLPYCRLLLIAALGFFLTGCDPERKRKCEWTLMPEPNHKDRQDPGYLAVCARNFVNMRQQCNLQIKEDVAKEVYQKYFKLSELEISEEGKFPKKILSVKLCEKE